MYEPQMEKDREYSYKCCQLFYLIMIWDLVGGARQYEFIWHVNMRLYIKVLHKEDWKERIVWFMKILFFEETIAEFS